MSSATSPYQIPKEPGRWRALLLAALVHLALVAFLWIGIRWQNETPIAVEAEVWDTQVKEAAPPPPPPAPVVETRPEPPKPAPKPVEPPKVVTPPVPKPDIALEQEKKRKEAEKRAQEHKLAEQKRAEDKKREEEKKRDEAKRKEDEQKKLALEKQKKLKAEKDKAEKDKAEQLASEQRHQENLKRMQAQAGGTGDAPKSQGPRSTDPSYAQRVAGIIRSHTTFVVPEGLSGNTPVEYDVQLLPDGSVRGVRKLRSSGVPGFDEAVARAIERSQPFPADKSGSVPGGFTLSHRPKDQ